MGRLKKSEFKPARDWIDALPKDRRDKIEAGAAEIVMEFHLAELRKAMSITQTMLASKSGIRQADISRIENRPETVQIKTMERYVRSLGGEFKIVAEFPDGTLVQIPLQSGKPVRSKMSGQAVGTNNGAADNQVGTAR